MSDDEQPRDAAAVKIFPPLVPVGIVLIGVALGKLWPIDLGLERWQPVLSTVGGLIVLFALGVIFWAGGVFHRTGQDPNPWKPTPEIVERGPFKISRNPMYLQMVLICVGFAIRHVNLWTLALTPLGAWLLHRFVILPEEAYLERKFGEPYLAYKRRVRRWL